MSSSGCLLCGQADSDVTRLGETFYLTDGSTVHHFCLLFSAKLAQNGKDDEGAEGFLYVDIVKEVQRCRTIRCCYCDSLGASAACCNNKCKLQYHVGCLLENGGLLQFFGFFKSFCRQHRMYQCLTNDIRNQTCGICLEDSGVVSPDIYICSPCCRNLFHKTCLQRMAYNFGYFFSCPGCRNNDGSKGFVKEMKQHGVFVPQRDASWELAPGAFQELLSPYYNCDAEYCLCPSGRRHMSSEIDSPWCLLTCTLCGSAGTHANCRLDNDCPSPNTFKSKWVCSLCGSVGCRSAAKGSDKLSVSAFVDRYMTSIDNDEDDCSVGVTSDRAIWLCDILRQVRSPQKLLKFIVNTLSGLKVITRSVAGSHSYSWLDGGLPVHFTPEQLLPTVVVKLQDRQLAERASLDSDRFAFVPVIVSSDDRPDCKLPLVEHDCSQTDILHDSTSDPPSVGKNHPEDCDKKWQSETAAPCSMGDSPVSTARPTGSEKDYSVDILLLDSMSESGSMDDPLASPSRSSTCEAREVGERSALNVEELVAVSDDDDTECSSDPLVISDSRSINANEFRVWSRSDAIVPDSAMQVKEESVYITDDAQLEPVQKATCDYNTSGQLATCSDPRHPPSSCPSNLTHRADPHTVVGTSNELVYSQIKQALAGFQCPVCGRSCVSLSSVTLHYYLHAEVRNQPPIFVCSQCGRDFLTTDQFFSSSMHSPCASSPDAQHFLISHLERAKQRVAQLVCHVRGLNVSEADVCRYLEDNDVKSTGRPVSIVKPFSINADELVSSSSNLAECSLTSVGTDNIERNPNPTTFGQPSVSTPTKRSREVPIALDSTAHSSKMANRTSLGAPEAVLGHRSESVGSCSNDNAADSLSTTPQSDLQVNLRSDGVHSPGTYALRQNRRSAVLTYNESTLSKINNNVSSTRGGRSIRGRTGGTRGVRNSKQVQRHLVQGLVSKYRNSRCSQNKSTRGNEFSPVVSNAVASTLQSEAKTAVVSTGVVQPPPNSANNRDLLNLSYVCEQQNRWDCPTCDYFYFDANQLALHVVEQHFAKRCSRSTCVYSNHSANNSVHSKFYHKTKPLKWKLCPVALCQTPRFAGVPHECVDHGNSDETVACPVPNCAVLSRNTTQLHDHLIVCHSFLIRGPAGARNHCYRCPFCAIDVKYFGWYSHVHHHKQLFKDFGSVGVNVPAISDVVDVKPKTPTRFDCPFCDMFYSEVRSYSKHMDMFHLSGNLTSKCPVAFCCWSDVHKSTLNRHIILCHKAAHGRIKCQFCDSTFGNAESLKKHQGGHSRRWGQQSATHSCSICGWAGVNNRRAHRVLCHSTTVRGVPGDPNARYVCPKCPSSPRFLFNNLVVHLTDSHNIVLKKTGTHAFHRSVKLPFGDDLNRPGVKSDSSAGRPPIAKCATDVKTVLNHRFGCIFCGIRFNSLDKVNVHEKLSHPVICRKMLRYAAMHLTKRGYNCKKCRTVYKRRRYFIRHHMTHVIGNKAKKGISARYRDRVKSEVDSANVRVNESCSSASTETVCTQSFRAGNYKLHSSRRKPTGKTIDTKYIRCPICPNKTCKGKFRLDAHIRAKHSFLKKSSTRLPLGASADPSNCQSTVDIKREEDRSNPDPQLTRDRDRQDLPDSAPSTTTAPDQAVPVGEHPAPGLTASQIEVIDISDSDDCGDPLAL